MGIMVKRPVLVKVVVTDEFKRQLAEEVDGALAQLELQLQQFEFQERRYTAELKGDMRQLMAMRQKFEEERQKMNAVRNEIVRRKSEIAQLNVGDEVVRGTLESSVEINEGDRFSEKLGQVELLVKDDIVISIREGQDVEMVS